VPEKGMNTASSYLKSELVFYMNVGGTLNKLMHSFCDCDVTQT